MHPWRPKVLFVANPISGGGRAVRMADALVNAVSGVVTSARRIDSKPGTAHAWLAQELEGVDLLVVVGGDGAVRQSAPLLADRATLLWHAPAGTENLFAKSVGMQSSALALIAAIESRRASTIDLAIATPDDGPAAGQETPFILMASCGFDAEVVHLVSAARRGAISHLSYAGPILAALGAYSAPSVRVEFGGETEERRDAGATRGGVVVANGPRYAMNINPVPSARLDDGQLHAVVLPGNGGLAALTWGARSLVRRGPPARSASTMRVHSDPPSRWQLDGDATQWGPVACVSFRLRERCVRILLPAPSAAGQGREISHASLVHPAEDWTVSSSA